MKYAIRGGHNFQATGARGIIDETTEDRKVKDAVIKYLRQAGHEVLDVTPPNGCDQNTDLAYGVDKANSWGADYFASIHFNKAYDSYNGLIGTEVWIYGTGGKAEPVAQRVVNKLATTGLKNRGVKVSQGLYELRNTDMSAMIVEVCFVEATEDVAIYQSKGYDYMGKLIAEGLINSSIDVTPEPTPTPAPSTTNLYRVRKSWDDAKSQIGAYAQLDNAKECVDANAGYIAFDWNGNQVYPAPQPAPAPSTDQMYRVRKSWDDVKGQIGAYKVLDNAKELADQHASEGYKVFDKDGNVVYTPASTPAPAPQPQPTPTPAPADTTPKVAIMGREDITVGQMVKFLKDHNAVPKIGIDVKDFCQLFLDEGAKEGVRGDIAFCQSVHETGYFQFGGQVLPEQHNYAGIGATNNSAVGKGAWFKDEHEGVTAQIQHLKAYASTNGLVEECVDPRFSLVTRGVAPYWTDLNGKWAVPGDTYGQMILALYEKLKNTTEPPVVDPTPAPSPAPTPNPAPSTDTKVLTLGQIIAEFITKLIEFFKKK